MASSAETLTIAAAAANYPALSLRQLMENWLVATQTVPASATSLTATAATENYPALSDRELYEAILVAIQAGGGGGLSGSGTPQGVLSASPGATYLDTSTGNCWAKQTGTGNTGWLELISS